jgi:NTP pyrophosphatase (non-canonical NTP hydrolase)
MNFKQYLYSKLAEESGELAQAAIKSQLWGENSTDPRETTGETNLTKLVKEFIDVHIIIGYLDAEMLKEEKGLNDDFDPKEYASKKKTAIMQNWSIVKELANG